MSDNFIEVIFIIFHWYFFDDKIFELGMWFILDECDGILSLIEYIIILFTLRKISITFDLSFLYEFTKHIYWGDVVLLDHSPEIVYCYC